MRKPVVNQFIEPESLTEILAFVLDREEARVGCPPSKEDVARTANELISYYGFEDRVAFSSEDEELDSFFYDVSPEAQGHVPTECTIRGGSV